MIQSKNSISILIIEDNPADQVLLSENLKCTQLIISEIKIAATLGEAITLLKQQNFSLIFLDFFLPDSNGMESYTELAKENSKIPVIILSGLSDTDLSLKAIALGAQDFLIKGDYTDQFLEKTVRYSIERKKNSILIEENNERHNTISKATNDIIWDWNLETKKVLWTGQGMENYISDNIITEDIPDNFWTSCLHKDEKQNIVRSLHKVIGSAENSWQKDYRFLKKDGTYAHMNARGYIIRNDAAKPVRMIGSMQDITDRKIAELETLKAKLEAEDARRSQEQFLANMSHEIRTPMNGIIGMTQLIAGTKLTEEQEEYVETIKESAANLLVIINDILDFTKIVAGKVLLEKVDYIFKDVVNNCIRITGFKAEEKSILLTSEIDKRIHPVLCGDPVRLNQILINLIGNAIKFTEKGQVKVFVELIGEDEKHVNLKFSVQDTGIGIAENNINSVFESFTQESSSTTRKYGGTGLGLTITKQLIELQGGTISVISKPGIGSTFSFSLTLRKGNINIIPAAKIIDNINEKQSVKPFSGIKILLVEDNLINQKVASYTLTKQGAEVDIANHGKEGIELIERNIYDVILMDIQMPEMDGFETAHYIRNHIREAINETPIIAMTASALVSEKTKCLAAGMNDYISKPFQAKELHDKITLQLKNKLNFSLQH